MSLRTPIEAAKLWHARYLTAEQKLTENSEAHAAVRMREEADLALEQDLLNAGLRNLFDDAILNIDFHEQRRRLKTGKLELGKVIVMLESGCELHFPV